jgi:tetratricopeptide (TPR) repeat protein
MRLPSEWNLIEQGQFELAYKRITEHIEKNPKYVLRYIYNRGLCLLNLEKPDSALEDFQKLIELRPDSASGYIGAGIASWWLNQKTNAIQLWKKTVESNYTDAAGGITGPALLFFAASRLHDVNLEKDSLRLLKAKSRTKRASAWPGPVAEYILGNISETDLIEKANRRPALKSRMLTKSHFWIGVAHYRRNDVQGYHYHLNQAYLGHMVEPEYYLAKIELQGIL